MCFDHEAVEPVQDRVVPVVRAGALQAVEGVYGGSFDGSGLAWVC
jgi:hypothetical protein